MENANLLLCAVSAAAIDICGISLIIAAYCDRSRSKKRWAKISGDMELVEQGFTYPLGCDEVLIGRHASADVRIPDLSVSRYHAVMTVVDGVWTITDVGSKSGVYVNGISVKHKKLKENDVITLGNRKLTLKKRREKNG